MREGVVTPDNATAVEYGTVVRYECDTGLFRFFGDRERTCQQNERLSGDLLMCTHTSM